MPFVKVSKQQRQKMYREGGWRERDVMKNSVCVTKSKNYPNCVTYHDKKNRRTATYRIGRGWVN